MNVHHDFRSPVAYHAVVRAADEGVPVRAISRIFRLPYDEVQLTISEAIEAGHLIAQPSADWPKETRRETRAPTVAPIRLGEMDDVIEDLARHYRLTTCEARLLAMLMRRGQAGTVSLHVALSRDGSPQTDPTIVKVFVSKLRKKLRPHGIEIETEWGRGYALTPEMNAAIRAAIGLCADAPGFAEAAE